MPNTKKARAVGFNHIALEVADIEEALAFTAACLSSSCEGRAKSPLLSILAISSSCCRRAGGSLQMTGGISGWWSRCARRWPRRVSSPRPFEESPSDQRAEREGHGTSLTKQTKSEARRQPEEGCMDAFSMSRRRLLGDWPRPELRRSSSVAGVMLRGRRRSSPVRFHREGVGEQSAIDERHATSKQEKAPTRGNVGAE